MSLTFEQYQKQAAKTAIYPHRGNNVVYPALGLCGEAGEVAERIKKVIRDNGGMIDDVALTALRKEIGDVFWYLGALCDELHLDMGQVAQENLDKLTDRHLRDVLRGDGSDR